ncbi:hypothetical protein AGMMS49991_00990 [Spirochaetia bacterium]|nr:hypothetical protein AGMMS49991_00990 [Spirochaetia bacterium]
MKRNVVLPAVMAAVLLVVQGQVFAQTSNTYKSTFGIFDTEVDNFMDVRKWSGVEFGKGFGFIGAGRDTGIGFQGGYATRFKGLYLGLFVNGNYWSGTGQDSYDKDGKRIDAGTDGLVDFDNQYAVLVGGGFGGIKLTVDFDSTKHDYDETLVPNPPSGSKTVKTYTDEGNLIFSVDWGTALKNGWKPAAGVSYNINLDGTITDFDGDVTTIVGNSTATGPGSSYNPDWLSLYAKSGIPIKTGYFGAQYKMDLAVQKPPYKFTGSPSVEVKMEGYGWNNTLSAWYGHSVDLTERFSIGAEIDLDLGFNFSQLKYSVDTVKAEGPVITTNA